MQTTTVVGQPGPKVSLCIFPRQMYSLSGLQLLEKGTDFAVKLHLN